MRPRLKSMAAHHRPIHDFGVSVDWTVPARSLYLSIRFAHVRHCGSLQDIDVNLHGNGSRSHSHSSGVLWLCAGSAASNSLSRAVEVSAVAISAEEDGDVCETL